MKNAIILHGSPYKKQYDDPNFPSTSNYYWLPWAQKQLSIKGIPAETPEVPNAWRAYYPTWKKTFERYEVTNETILIGHSCGAGFIVRWLSENKHITTDKVILIAPWLDPQGGDPDNAESLDFFNFMIDTNLVARTKGLVIISSDNDMKTIQTSVKILMKKVKNIKYVELHNRKHFFDENAMKLPELIEQVMS